MSEFPNNVSFANRESSAESKSKNTEAGNSDDIDMSVLLGFEDAQGDGEPDLIVELIDLYLEDVPLQLSAMKDFVLKADAVSLKRAAHNIKGSSANLGAKAVAALCEELEQTDLSDSLQQSKIIIDRLEQAFARVHTLFSAERLNRV